MTLDAAMRRSAENLYLAEHERAEHYRKALEYIVRWGTLNENSLCVDGKGFLEVARRALAEMEQ